MSKQYAFPASNAVDATVVLDQRSVADIAAENRAAVDRSARAAAARQQRELRRTLVECARELTDDQLLHALSNTTTQLDRDVLDAEFARRTK